MSSEQFPEPPSPSAVSRRSLLLGGLLGGAGLAAAALIGCADDDGTDGTPPGSPSGSATSTEEPGPEDGDGEDGEEAEQRFLNAALLELNDPSLPFPYHIGEPDIPPIAGGVFRIGMLQEFQTADPTKSNAGGTLPQINAVCERLLGFVGNADLNQFEIQLTNSGLATSWETSPDGLTITFDITDEARFHNIPPVDGRALTAEDIRLVYQRYRDEGLHTGEFANAEFEAPDDTTFVVRLSRPQPDITIAMGSRELPVYPMELVDGENLLDANVLIGTGPMILEEIDPVDHATFMKNPDYWQGDVLLDGSEWKVLPDIAARVTELRAGNLDWGVVAQSRRDAEALIEVDPGIRVAINPIFHDLFPIGLNLRNAKFEDERVRQALSLSINRDEIIETVYEGLAATVSALPWLYTFDRPPSGAELGNWLRYDPDEAAKLLAAAGQQEMEFQLLYTNLGPIYQTVNEMVAEQLATVGLRMQLEETDIEAFTSQYLQATYEEAVDGWVTGGFSADAFFRDHLVTGAPGNRWHISDPDIDTWAEQQSSELDPDARRELLRRIWDRMLERMYRIPKVAANEFQVYPPHVMNFRIRGPLNSVSPNGDEGTFLAKVWLNPPESEE